MAPKKRSVPDIAADAIEPRGGAPSPRVGAAGPLATPRTDDEIAVPTPRGGRAKRSRLESSAADGAGAPGDDAASSSGGGPRFITDLRADSIENLRVEHRRLREATRTAQREMRNAKRRRNRILNKIRNLDVESVLSVLIDRGLTDPSAAATPAAASVQPPAPPTAARETDTLPTHEDAAEDAAESEPSEAEPAESKPEDGEEPDLEELKIAQQSASSSAAPPDALAEAPAAASADAAPEVLGDSD
jgi:hypothetical protein